MVYIKNRKQFVLANYIGVIDYIDIIIENAFHVKEYPS